MRNFAFRALGGAVFLAGVFLILEDGRESSDALKALSPDATTKIAVEPTHPEPVMHADADAASSPTVIEPQVDAPLADSSEVRLIPTARLATPARFRETELARRKASEPSTSIPKSGDTYRDHLPADFSPATEPSSGTVILMDNLEVEIASGQPLPVAVLASTRDSTMPNGFSERQTELAEQITADFARDLAKKSTPNGSDSLRASLPSLQSAANIADERFRALFGQDIYNREIVRQHQVQN